ncbi:MAG: hypothetical protein KIS77_16570 [Saprospiraceae bacterium]|nr:hypothetical protein [Saprospiraceae bacterium]
MADEKAVEHGAAVGVVHVHHVVGVVGAVARRADVAAQHGGARLPVALREVGLGAREAAVERHAALEREGNSAVGAGGRPVLSLGHPHLVAGLGRGEGGLQVGVGVRPRRAVVLPGGRVADVEALLGAGGAERPEEEYGEEEDVFHENKNCVRFV